MGSHLNSNGDSGANRRVLSELLIQMDGGFRKNEIFFIIGATNTPDIFRPSIKASKKI
ncbi:AAA family ATPase [Candidatus Coxiella mudrowiae]|uniref:AAA family ATPase n=1 Tax=Candidatus Coxiella mudrowiae TaxID=2054173 RepID=UPI003CC8334F